MSRGCRCGYDGRRVAYMAGCGMGAGVLCHYWYLALDRWWVGRSFGIVAKKVTAIYGDKCCLLCSPL